ncbi:putative transcription factor C2H2 family [Rosa chinensis]|uniref:Putative transcription factor C2H2 family n=2 Tax=Rosa chinensis TaxID=74649 RepID=A0A2P6S7H8_ROSCH|nr:putative transcription factor C2H2 family [Rosa chinensis]
MKKIDLFLAWLCISQKMDRDELYDSGGVFIGVLAIIILIIVISYCHRRQSLVDPSDHDESSATTEQGLDEATICAYPKLLYSEAKLHLIDSISCTSPSCCSICLADFEDKDVLRSVPNCGHFFHQLCVDKWLLLHPTCPVCRNSLVDPLTSVGSVPEV